MSNSVEDGIIVELDGDEFVIWKPGTVFLIAFKKPDYLASELAFNQARSLGWDR